MDPDLDQRLSELMRRAQDGDGRAYERLLEDVTRLLESFVRRRVGPPDWQEEIVQETLLCIHRDRHTYDPRRPFRPWMYAIARHRLLEHVERQRRRGATELHLTRDAQERAAGEVRPADVASSRLLGRALAQLSKAQREVIEMLKLQGLTVAEIASRTGLSVSTVKVTAHRGYKKLRALLGEP